MNTTNTPWQTPRFTARLGLIVAALSWLPLTCAAGMVSAPAALDACNAPTPSMVLRAESPGPTPASATPAQATWLDAQTLHWPGADPQTRYRLQHSRGSLALQVQSAPLPARFAYLGAGTTLRLPPNTREALREWLRAPLQLQQIDSQGQVVRSTPLQVAGALDDLYASATMPPLGVQTGFMAAQRRSATRLSLWAPTAAQVQACLYPDEKAPASTVVLLQRNSQNGIWSWQGTAMPGSTYTYLVDVELPGVGLVRNRVTDPYSVSLTANSARSAVLNLDDPALQPIGWVGHRRPAGAEYAVDQRIYELHVRDFSANDPSVPAEHRGKYLAFTHADTYGMRHLRALAQAGMTDIHLLPVFDFATVPETGCTTPALTAGARADGPEIQASVMAQAATDCFNWGYDPLHYNAPEGSYATNAADPAVRVRELRQAIMALHGAGLRVGMDVVYNHTSASGQHAQSVLDRIVPGYYQRLSPQGALEQSTCCANTASEHAMMARLMVDSVALWARQYQIDSFRFDLMGHQPKAAMLQVAQAARKAAGRVVPLLGEGWNFGEVANAKRFVQASQLSLGGSGIATFSDRARDAIRGGGAGDNGADLVRHQGYINGLYYDPNALGDATRTELLAATDLVRVGLAGSIASYRLQTQDGPMRPLSSIDYAHQPAGYAQEPGEVVNYVENHDNQTLWDANAFKLPQATSSAQRARVQMLGFALTALSQGVAYFHAGVDILRSKSLDRNSFDSGDWFNRVDWTYQTNHFGSGLPPAADNATSWPLMAPLLADPALRATPQDIAWARDMARDWLSIRASTTLLRLRTATDIRERLRFFNTGLDQEPTVIAAAIQGRGYPGANFSELLYLVNVDTRAHTLHIQEAAGQPWTLHPVLRRPNHPDAATLALADADTGSGNFHIPARTALVYVLP